MRHDHLAHQHHLPRLHGVAEIYFAHTLTGLANALIAVFVPIFLYKVGYSLEAIFWFFIVQTTASLALQSFTLRLSTRFGFLRVMAIGGLFGQAIFYGLLLTLPTYHWPLWLIALPTALAHDAYYGSFHVIFSSLRTPGKAGRQLSLASALFLLVGGIAPAVGGVAASELGISAVYGVALGLLIVAGVVLLTAEEVVSEDKLDIRAVPLPRVWRDLVANATTGFVWMAENIAWPLLIFFTVHSYSGVGLLSAAIALAAIVVTLYAGRREETRGERHFLKEGSWIAGLANLIRAVSANAVQIFGVNLFSGIGRSLVNTPFLTRYYQHADEESRLGYVWWMEVANTVGAILALAVLLAGLTLFSQNTALAALLVLAAPISLGVRLIR